MKRCVDASKVSESLSVHITPSDISTSFFLDFQEAIVVFDPTTDEHIRYETFFPDREGRYSRSACERLQVASEDGEMSDDEDHHTCSRSGSGAESELEIVDDHDRGRADNVGIDTQTSDDDDEWEDETTHISSGVCDILITGEVRVCSAVWFRFLILSLHVRRLNATAKLGAIINL